MTVVKGLRRRVLRVLGGAFAALFVVSLAPVPAHATLGPARTVNIQIQRYNNGGWYNVGRVYGTIQFDDNDTQYRLSLTVCRQSSYTSPNVRISTNGVPGGTYSGEDNVRRPQICGGFGSSYVIDGVFTRTPIVTGVGIRIDTVFFDGSTATPLSGGAGFDNPYN